MTSALLTFLLIFPAPERDDLVPIHVFHGGGRRVQPIYTTSRKNIERLKRSKSHEYRGILGFGSKTPGPGKKRLWCARRDGFLVYYLDAPERLPRQADIVKEFEVYVWEKKTRETRSVYAASRKDYRSMFLSMDKSEVKKRIETVESAARIKLTNRGIFFYLVPPE